MSLFPIVCHEWGVGIDEPLMVAIDVMRLRALACWLALRGRVYHNGMRVGVGIASGVVGLLLYGALYSMAFSCMFSDPELVLRMVLIGMLLSGIAFLVGFRLLEDDGIVLFAKALALPLIGTAVFLIVAIFLAFISEDIADILLVGIGGALSKLYDFVNWVFFPVR